MEIAMKKVLTGGCFNKIHPGHKYLLKKAKALGFLVIVLTNDKNNKKKNAIPAQQRKKNLEKLNIADKIVVGDEKNFMKVVKKEKPNIIILGYDQKLPVPKAKLKGIVVKKFRRYGNY